MAVLAVVWRVVPVVGEAIPEVLVMLDRGITEQSMQKVAEVVGVALQRLQEVPEAVEMRSLGMRVLYMSAALVDRH